MKYNVLVINVNVNGAIKWTAVATVRGLNKAREIADRQTIRACVSPYTGGPAVYDNGKPHGGNPCFLRSCPCPLCQA